jgi:hypothetical protein
MNRDGRIHRAKQGRRANSVDLPGSHATGVDRRGGNGIQDVVGCSRAARAARCRNERVAKSPARTRNAKPGTSRTPGCG